MAFTTHGHHIPGTLWNGAPETGGALCGGPRHCSRCAKDVEAYYSNNPEKGDKK